MAASPLKITTSPPPLLSRFRATFGLAAMFRSFGLFGWLKIRNVCPSQRNQTGLGCGALSSRTVVSHMTCSSRNRRSTRDPNSVVVSHIPSPTYTWLGLDQECRAFDPTALHIDQACPPE